jgi:hypothetical protein
MPTPIGDLKKAQCADGEMHIDAHLWSEWPASHAQLRARGSDIAKEDGTKLFSKLGCRKLNEGAHTLIPRAACASPDCARRIIDLLIGWAYPPFA